MEQLPCRKRVGSERSPSSREWCLWEFRVDERLLRGASTIVLYAIRRECSRLRDAVKTSQVVAEVL